MLYRSPLITTSWRQSGPLGRGNLPLSLVLIFPLFFAYEIGALFSNTLNGVDFASRIIFAAAGNSGTAYLAIHLCLALAFCGYIMLARRRDAFRWQVLGPLLLECTVYALTLGTAIVFVLDTATRVLPLALGDVALGPRGIALVTSLGAGVFEEVVFRLGILSGVFALLRHIGVQRFACLMLAIAVSALLFSLAHHIGTNGEPFDRSVFLFRMLAGVAFSLIYYFRSLAHAVYSHFLYDAYVLVIL